MDSASSSIAAAARRASDRGEGVGALLSLDGHIFDRVATSRRGAVIGVLGIQTAFSFAQAVMGALLILGKNV